MNLNYIEKGKEGKNSWARCLAAVLVMLSMWLFIGGTLGYIF